MIAWQRALRATLALWTTQRRLWLPFFIAAFVEAFFLLLVWLAPHPPFKAVLAPPIRYFFAEGSLHYPWHLWLMYHVMKHTHLAATLLVGAFLSGIASLMVQQIHAGQPVSLRDALLSRRARYATLVVIWLVAWALTHALLQGLAAVLPKAAWQVWVNVAAIILLQSLFVYPIAVSVFEGLPWWRALPKGLGEFLRHPLSTLGMVVPPAGLLLVMSLWMTENRVVQWMMQQAPELAVLCVFARLLVTTAADALLTVGVAHLWLFHRETAARKLEAGK